MSNGGVSVTVLAGVSGIDKKPFVDGLVARSGRHGKIESLDFDEGLLERRGSLSIPAFLDTPSVESRIEGIEGRFDQIADYISNQGDLEHVFLRMHLSYFRNSEVFLPPLPNLFLSLLNKMPNSRLNIITLIDDVYSIWQKIRARAARMPPGTDLRLRDIMIWRSIEMSCAESIRHHLESMVHDHKSRVGCYHVSTRHPYSTFENLIFEKYPRRVYLSYPITSTRGNPAAVEEINRFRREAHALGSTVHAAVFDPVAIDELALVKAQRESGDSGDVVVERSYRWPLGVDVPLAEEPEWPIRLPAQEVSEVLGGSGGRKGDVEDQIRSRDYRLVEASNCLAVYRPFFGGKKSEGVDAEIKHAVEHGREVVAYHPRKDQTSVGQATTHPFGSNITLIDDYAGFMGRLEGMLSRSRSR